MENKEGEKLRNLIKGLGLEMNQFAESLNMTRQNLNYHLRKDKLELDFLKKVENVLLKYGVKNAIIENGTKEDFVKIEIDKDMESIEHIQIKALVKINRLAIAKLMAKVFNRDVSDCLDELENDTKLVIRELVGERE